MDHHHPFLILLSCGALAGCYGEARYHSELAEESCVLYEDCGVMEAYGHVDLAGCISAAELAFDAASADCPEHDGAAAKACVWGIREMDCQALEDQSYPEECGMVCGTGD